MPFKSEAQRAKLAQLVKEGKMKQSVFDKFQSETPDTPLPKRLTPKIDNKPKTIAELQALAKKKLGR